MKRAIRLAVVGALVSVLGGPLLLLLGSSALQDHRQPLLSRVFWGAVVCFEYFWPGLLVAGALSGLIGSLVPRARASASTMAGILVPLVLLPSATLAMIWTKESGGVPLIQNADPYVYAGALVGIFVGVCVLASDRQRRDPTLGTAAERADAQH